MTNTLTHPGRFPYMASIFEENEWLRSYNNYSAANAADEGFTHYLKGLRFGTSALSPIVWCVKEVATDLTVSRHEDQMDALKALDAIEAQS